MATLQLCTFELAGTLFGVDVGEVQEILPARERTRVPRAATVIAGLMNLRGQIVATIDLARLLELAPAAGAGHPAHELVLRGPHGPLSLLVEEIGAVLEVERAQLEPCPPTVPAAVRRSVHEVCALEERLLLVLDTRAAREAAFGPELSGAPGEEAHG